MIPVTYGYARVSKTDNATRNLETQLLFSRDFGSWEELSKTATSCTTAARSAGDSATDSATRQCDRAARR